MKMACFSGSSIKEKEGHPEGVGFHSLAPLTTTHQVLQGTRRRGNGKWRQTKNEIYEGGDLLTVAKTRFVGRCVGI